MLDNRMLYNVHMGSCMGYIWCLQCVLRGVFIGFEWVMCGVFTLLCTFIVIYENVNIINTLNPLLIEKRTYPHHVTSNISSDML